MNPCCRLFAFASAIALVAPVAIAQTVPVSITVDDLSRTGPATMGMTRTQIAQTLLNGFAAHQVPGVYGFVNSRRVINNNEQNILNLWLNAGYPLGNHTATHPDMRTVGVTAFTQDLDEGELLLAQLMGTAQSRVYKTFRFPFSLEGTNLGTKEQIRTHLAVNDYRITPLTIDIFDWAFHDAYSRCVAQNNQAALTQLRELWIATALQSLNWSINASQAFFGRQIKHILLMHVGAMSADMVERFLSDFESQGVVWISVEEAMTDPLYSIPTTRSSGSFLQEYRQINPQLYPTTHPIEPSTAAFCP
jgi:peptidoglycan/xylan/chitin deacetylase (PgdA/CDA1 family)